MDQTRLRQLLDYHPETGIFTWKESRGRQKKGANAGYGAQQVQIRIEGVTQAAPRLAWLYMTGEWPEGHLRHLNRNNMDNRWENLAPKKAPDIELTTEVLRVLLHYDPETGEFTWADPLAPQMCPGDTAGSVGGWGYVYIGVLGRSYPAHRLAWLYMTGEWPIEQIDHRNRNTLDNRWDNLRDATQFQNSCNRKKPNKLGIKGVIRNTRGGKFSGLVTAHGVQMRTTSYATPEEAHSAVSDLRDQLHGAFACH